VLAGKCGIHWQPGRRQCVDGRPERIEVEVEESLRRLGTDHLDLLYLHAPDPVVPIEESAAALQRLFEAGKTRSIGASNMTVELLDRFVSACPLSACQMPYNMLQRGIEEAVLPWCRTHDVAMVVYWPLMKGLLAGRMQRGQVFPASDSRHKYPMFNGTEFERNLDFVAALRPVATRLGCELPDLVLAWTASQPGITSVLFGATSPAQVAENARGLTVDLDDQALTDIRAAIAARGPVASRRAV
jgi:aryl-alcohol dehydrogenase-like predicted oxidoreductase